MKSFLIGLKYHMVIHEIVFRRDVLVVSGHHAMGLQHQFEGAVNYELRLPPRSGNGCSFVDSSSNDVWRPNRVGWVGVLWSEAKKLRRVITNLTGLVLIVDVAHVFVFFFNLKQNFTP